MLANNKALRHDIWRERKKCYGILQRNRMRYKDTLSKSTRNFIAVAVVVRLLVSLSFCFSVLGKGSKKEKGKKYGLLPSLFFQTIQISMCFLAIFKAIQAIFYPFYYPRWPTPPPYGKDHTFSLFFFWNPSLSIVNCLRLDAKVTKPVISL